MTSLPGHTALSVLMRGTGVEIDRRSSRPAPSRRRAMARTADRKLNSGPVSSVLTAEIRKAYRTLARSRQLRLYVRRLIWEHYQSERS